MTDIYDRITFDVVGSTLAELKAAALEQLRLLIGVETPYAEATFNVEPEHEIGRADGATYIASWRATAVYLIPRRP
jgi:hypothetical protein